MDMEPVDSTAIHSVGYDPALKTLRVKFHSGATYDYSGVPVETHQAFMSAPSLGAHLARHVKGVHQHTRVE